MVVWGSRLVITWLCILYILETSHDRVKTFVAFQISVFLMVYQFVFCWAFFFSRAHWVHLVLPFWPRLYIMNHYLCTRYILSWYFLVWYNLLIVGILYSTKTSKRYWYNRHHIHLSGTRGFQSTYLHQLLRTMPAGLSDSMAHFDELRKKEVRNNAT